MGIPVPAATHWEQLEHGGTCASPICKPFETLAAQGDGVYQDDPPARILALLDEKQAAMAQAPERAEATPRTGRYPTALSVQVGERRSCLYDTGRRQAGENLAALVAKREAQRGNPLVRSDALASNRAAEDRLSRCQGLAHGRRKFSELDAVFPAERAVVTEALKLVFEHAAEARVQQLSAQARVADPQTDRGPIMARLKDGVEHQTTARLVEPHSSLGQALPYLPKHWQTLTRFLPVPGAPLANNTAERAVKLGIRQRKNARFSATEHSADSARLLTSVIATWLQAGGNALEYLGAVPEHRPEVFAPPAAWLPWTYPAARAPP